MTNDAYSSAGSRAARETSGMAVGFILFAAIMLIMAGVFQAIQGLVAIFENEFYVATRNYLFEFDATAWGWIHLLIGLLVVLAGWGVVVGAHLGAGRGHHLGGAQCHRQLSVHPLLPDLVVADYRGGRIRDLGHRRPWPGGWGLTVAAAYQG